MAVGLVLEGGGMRGTYTAGALDMLMEHEIHIPYVVAVSAGACNALSYVAGQPRRNHNVLIKYIRDPRYLSLRNLLKKGSIFDFDFVIDEVGIQLEPLDMQALIESDIRMVTGVTDIETAEALYFEKDVFQETFDYLRASCSQPIVGKIITIGEHKLLDGGIADPIPIERSIADGNDKNIIILTRHHGYQKKKELSKRICNMVYGNYPKLVELLMNRAEMYNQKLAYCHQLEEEGKAVIICPEDKLNITRLDKNQDHLRAAYKLGRKDAHHILPKIQKLLQ